MNKKILAIGICILMIVMVGCSNKKEDISVDLNKSVHKQAFLLDTFIDIKLYGTDNEGYIDEAMKIISSFDNDLSSYKTGGDIDRLNHSKMDAIELKPTTVECIKEGLRYSELTDGHFDVTIGAVSLMWDFKQHGNGTIPPDKDIQQALTRVNYKDISIDGNKVKFNKPNMKLDLGAIAKGFIADKVKEYLENKGIKSGVLNFGGNVVTIGKKGGDNFKIGIQNPQKQRNEIIGVTQINNSSLVTSGVYERFIDYRGKRYHHILDAKTGYPCSDEISQVTIYSEKSVDGDGLSTSAFLLGKKKGMELINSLPGVEAVFYTKDNEPIYSKNFQNKTNWKSE